MGSLEEEERLVQMVHDFIESSESSSPLPIFPPSNCLSIDHQTKYYTLQEILGKITKREAKVLASVLKHMRRKKENEETSTLKKWLVMRLKIDGFNASICQTSWVTSLGCPAGDYEYIDIKFEEENGKRRERLIVDTEFRSQFEVARPTKSYKQFTDLLPSTFVGSEEKLKKIISLLCSAAKKSLTERGLHVPPWRTSKYMQSKWLKVNDICYNTFSMWAPPTVNPKRRNLDSGGGGGGSGGCSALSSQFSSKGINCC